MNIAWKIAEISGHQKHFALVLAFGGIWCFCALVAK